MAWDQKPPSANNWANESGSSNTWNGKTPSGNAWAPSVKATTTYSTIPETDKKWIKAGPFLLLESRCLLLLETGCEILLECAYSGSWTEDGKSSTNWNIKSDSVPNWDDIEKEENVWV